MKMRGTNGLVTETHGGLCCGINHLHSFPEMDAYTGVTTDERVGWINAGVNAVMDKYFSTCNCSSCQTSGRGSLEGHRKNWKVAIEVVLNEHQTSEWREPLEIVGFKEVFSFHNSNSNNDCHVFYFVTNS